MKILCKNTNWKLNKKYNFDKILYLLIDRPNRINSCNNFIWENKNGYYRDYDLPTIIYSQTTQQLSSTPPVIITIIICLLLFIIQFFS